MNYHPILKTLGITPEMIARHSKISRVKLTQQRKARIANVAAGLTVNGTPRLRSPNGTRLNYYQRYKERALINKTSTIGNEA